ncbi:MAG: F0F1 ATP synthase subunit delta [Gammaproteobacteria bacterium]|nr:F0F1 ATP synthase subunit delta [Gammaproteobacteria bacterium]
MTISIARAKPYAKAIFNLALKDDELLVWQQTLNILAHISLMCKESHILDNPEISIGEKIDLFSEAVRQSPKAINLVRLLAERKELYLLSDVADSYQKLFFAHNKMLEVKVFSARQLTVGQKESLLSALKERYQKEILLQCDIDDELIGGAVMYIEDKVIDSSIRGILQLLKQKLLLRKAHAKTK